METCWSSQMLVHHVYCDGELQLKYAKEKEQFNGDADGLEAWLDDLRSLTQQSKNAIFFGSSEIQQLAKKQFNLKKSLEELFVKLMNEQLDATGISKWHEEAEKHHIHFIGCCLKKNACSTSKLHQQELEGGQWEIPCFQVPKGNSCPIKLERWTEDDADDDTAVPLVIDRDGNAVCHVQDAG
ncbi:hypothetical protein BS47DRAFT_1368523 [Hydnum rufescens UP504]|uniref:Uncharacterized protein n=1 Tax=Hydnum rufescens UP504 TaxID=1448309 RepID=A0A9P6AFD4_9AGAM|nr:hypothetical protein BS47DRAFT_1368523 [Hydnum rufescens UP504]